MIECIIYTDMTKHFPMIETLKNLAQKEEDFNPFEQDKQFMLSTLLHMADLSNPAKPFGQARVWGKRISAEFHNQVQEEEKRGMPVTQFMTGLEKEVMVCKQEIGFISFVVKPLWDATNTLLEGVYQAQVDNIN